MTKPRFAENMFSEVAEDGAKMTLDEIGGACVTPRDFIAMPKKVQIVLKESPETDACLTFIDGGQVAVGASEEPFSLGNATALTLHSAGRDAALSALGDQI
ncbi:MAG: hypothetical protein AAF636_06340 [Pseudomonadota bacterium]